MEKNFDIQKMNNNLAVAKNNTSVFNSGYLPTLKATAGGNYSNNNTNIVLLNDAEKDFLNAETVLYNGGVSVNYVLFNGMARKNKFAKLKEVYKLASIQKKELINNVLYNVYNSYYAIAKTELSKSVLEEAYEISKQRLTRITYKFNYGQKTKLELLNAKVDANNDSLKIVNLNVQLENLKRNLSNLIGGNLEGKYAVEKSVNVNSSLGFEEIKQAMLQNNYLLNQMKLNKTITEYDLKISKSGYMPQISANVGYSLNNGIYSASLFFKEQNVNGLGAGLNLSWNIFDGGTTKTRVQNAKINMLNQELSLEQIKLNLQTQLANTWANYQYELTSISSEKMNVELSQENFNRTKERYNLGQISSIDFRQAQLNLINSKIKLIHAQFSAKLAEVQLKKLSGGLVE